jgi:hypothetical protein
MQVYGLDLKDFKVLKDLLEIQVLLELALLELDFKDLQVLLEIQDPLDGQEIQDLKELQDPLDGQEIQDLKEEQGLYQLLHMFIPIMI